MPPEVIRERKLKLDRRFPIIIAVAIVLHVIWGVGLLMDPSSHNATAIHAIMLIANDSPFISAMILFFVALIASFGVIWHADTYWLSGRVIRVLCFLPQQCVLIISATGAATAILSSSFADGVIRPVWFIVVDQVPIILIMLGNVLAVSYFARGNE